MVPYRFENKGSACQFFFRDIKPIIKEIVDLCHNAMPIQVSSWIEGKLITLKS